MKKLKTALLGLAVLAMPLTVAGCGAEDELTIVHFDQTILGESQKDLGVSIGIKKGDATLESKLNASLAKIDGATRTKWMIEAVDRAAGVYDTTETTPYTVSTDPSLPVLTIGLECDYQPFNWTEVKANDYTYQVKGSNEFAEGYDIQMARFLAYDMNYRLEVVKLKWDALIPALEAGTVNAVIAGMTDTPKRRESIDFSDEYYRSEMVLIVRKDSDLANATSLEAFRGKKIVSQIETVTDEVIDDWAASFGVNHVNPLDTFATCAIAVRNKTVDAMTAELPVAQAICAGR